MNITFGGKPVTLNKTPLSVGEKAPDVTLINNDLNTVKLSDFKEKMLVLSVVPSVDTSVCSIQTKTFNKRLNDMDDVLLITISMDLPFAQKRYCANEGLKEAITLSDHKDAHFAEAFGVLINEMRLLTRSVFILDENRTIVYRDIIKEIGNEPDYDATINAIKDLG